MSKNPLFLIAGIIILMAAYISFPLGIQVQAHSLARNGYPLHLVSFQDPWVSNDSAYRNILLIHGLTYSSGQFDLNIRDYSLARYLAKRGFHVWLLDLTGYGLSGNPENGFEVDTQYAAQDINTAVDYILRTESDDKISILGWSWGTLTTSQFAIMHPEKVDKLILYAPIIHGLDFPAPQTDYQAFSMSAATEDFSDRTESDVLEAYLERVQQDDGDGSPNGGRRELSQGKHVQLIPYQKLKTPTLFIAGDADPYLSALKDLTLLIEHAPQHSCAIMFQGAGHALFLEKAYYREFQADVADFLNNGCRSQGIKTWP